MVREIRNRWYKGGNKQKIQVRKSLEGAQRVEQRIPQGLVLKLGAGFTTIHFTTRLSILVRCYIVLCIKYYIQKAIKKVTG